jgi:hypothetical protein
LLLLLPGYKLPGERSGSDGGVDENLLSKEAGGNFPVETGAFRRRSLLTKLSGSFSDGISRPIFANLWLTVNRGPDLLTMSPKLNF